MIKKRKIRQLQKTENEGIPETVVTNRYLTVLRILKMYPDVGPKMEEFNRPFAQINF